jgi:hypothetical protein
VPSPQIELIDFRRETHSFYPVRIRAGLSSKNQSASQVTGGRGTANGLPYVCSLASSRPVCTCGGTSRLQPRREKKYASLLRGREELWLRSKSWFENEPMSWRNRGCGGRSARRERAVHTDSFEHIFGQPQLSCGTAYCRPDTMFRERRRIARAGCCLILR